MGTITRRRLTHAIPPCLLLVAGLMTPAGAVADDSRDGPRTVADAQWTLAASGAPRAWQVTRGDGVTVAVLDSGVDASHPDLRGQVRGGGDFGDGSSGDGTHDPGPTAGHGTEVASVVAATGRNYHGRGLLGIAPDARVLSLGVYRDGDADPSAVREASRAAVGGGADVLVVPAAGLTRDVLRTAGRADAVVVTGLAPRPAGTRVGLPDAPGAVAAVPVDRSGHAVTATMPYRGASIAAPGRDILSASASGSYWTGDDPAFAAAAVAGAAALLRAAHPRLTASQVVGLLVDTAQPGPRGCGHACGAGLLRVDRALAAAGTTPASHTSPGPTSSPDRARNGAVLGLLVLLVASAAATGWWRLRSKRGPTALESRR